MILLLSKFLAALVSVSLGAGILARDYGLKANRLMAALLFANAYWASCEFFLIQADDAASAVTILRWSSLGWMPLGILCLRGSITLSGMNDHPLARLSRVFYGLLAMMLPVAIGSDRVVSGVARTSWGWYPTFGPYMGVAVLILVIPLLACLLCWRHWMRVEVSESQRAAARIVFYGLAIAGTVTAMTDAVLPMLGYDCVPMASSVAAAVCGMAALAMSRHGHSMISPEAFAREILDTLSDGVVLIGDGGRIRDANRTFVEWIGCEPGAERAHPITRWIPDFPEKPADVEAASFVHLEGPDGCRVPIVVSRPVACHAAGRIVGYAFLLRDRREIVSLRQQLIVSARLAAVGDLSKSISESIMEPVDGTRASLEALSADWTALAETFETETDDGVRQELLDEGRELVQECLEGVDRIAGIVHEVEGFSSNGKRSPFETVELSEIVQRASRMASARAEENVEIEARLDPGVRVRCNHGEIEQVITNVMVNAVQSSGADRSGLLNVAVGVAARGTRALVHVEDDGCGIRADALERIFDPFFTTKPVGEGMGLGLAISYHIVQAHGGEIRVSSVPGRGTSVTIDLPLDMPMASTGKAAPTSETRPA